MLKARVTNGLRNGLRMDDSDQKDGVINASGVRDPVPVTVGYG